VVVTTVVWLTTTLLTQPETDERLAKFYRRVQPTIHGWKRIAALAPEIAPVRDFAANTFDWVMGCTLVYCAMFGIGELVLQAWLAGVVLLACAAIAGYLIYWSLSRRGWQTLSGSLEKPVAAAAEPLGLQQTD
jgi:solute:Na+ symporter, SSS family